MVMIFTDDKTYYVSMTILPCVYRPVVHGSIRYTKVWCYWQNDSDCSTILSVVLEMLDPTVDYFEDPVDIFVIGFEEIVDLNAGNIMSAR